MAYTQITDHEAQALARLAAQFEEATNLRALVSVGAAGAQDGEDVLWALYTERLLDASVGAQLDNLGAVVGQPRDAATDDQYRARIAGRILANRSNNTVETLLSIVRAVLGSTVQATLTQYPPAAFAIDVSGAVSEDDADALADLIGDARAAGVGSQLITSTSPDDETLTFEAPVCFLDQSILAGEGVLTVDGDETAFPLSGTLRIGEGTANEEDVVYVSRGGGEFELDGLTVNAHALGDAVVVLPTGTRHSLGDDAVPATGGVFAGVLEA